MVVTSKYESQTSGKTTLWICASRITFSVLGITKKQITYFGGVSRLTRHQIVVVKDFVLFIGVVS